jgi:hypothetical protein
VDLEWWKLVLPLAISVLLAMAGFGVKYLNDLSIARRKDRLDRVSRQLGELYHRGGQCCLGDFPRDVPSERQLLARQSAAE